MMKKLMPTVLAVLALSATTVAAQTVSGSAQVTIPQILAFSVTNTTMTLTATEADFTSGFVAPTTSSSVSTRGNVPHIVTLSADAAYFTDSDADPANDKPASDLEWALDGGTWNGLSTTDATVLSLGRGSHMNVGTVDYRILLDLANDQPDTYGLSFTYTLTAN